MRKRADVEEICHETQSPKVMSVREEQIKLA